MMGTPCTNYMNTNLIRQRIKIKYTEEIGTIISVSHDNFGYENYTIQFNNELRHIDVLTKCILVPWWEFWWYKIKMYFKKGK